MNLKATELTSRQNREWHCPATARPLAACRMDYLGRQTFPSQHLKETLLFSSAEADRRLLRTLVQPAMSSIHWRSKYQSLLLCRLSKFPGRAFDSSQGEGLDWPTHGLPSHVRMMLKDAVVVRRTSRRPEGAPSGSCTPCGYAGKGECWTCSRRSSAVISTLAV